jgi:hypothetical protein
MKYSQVVSLHSFCSPVRLQNNPHVKLQDESNKLSLVCCTVYPHLFHGHSTFSDYQFTNFCNRFQTLRHLLIPHILSQSFKNFNTRQSFICSFKHFMCFCSWFPKFKKKENVCLLLQHNKTKHNLHVSLLQITWMRQSFFPINPWQS